MYETKVNLNTAAISEPVFSPVRYLDQIFSELSIERDIRFKEAVNGRRYERLLLDVISPSGDIKRDRPAIIWAHGGGLSDGSKDSPLERYCANEMAKKGYVIVSINYRLRRGAESDFTEAMRNAAEDVVSAFEWLVSNSQRHAVDRSKITLAGYSAGAEIVTNLCYTKLVDGWDRSRVFSVVDVAGNRLFYGNALEKSPPCLVIHGTDDTINPIEASRLLIESLKCGSIDCELKTVMNSNHYFNGNMNNLKDIGRLIAQFIYERLRLHF